MSLLKSDKELMESLSTTRDLATEDKVAFLDAQIDGIKSQMWRSRVDAILNRNIATADDKEKAAVLGKVAEHETDVKRYAEAVSLMEELKDELQAN